jgi:hypothetical protein
MTASDIKCTGYSTIRTVLASSLKSEIGSNKSEAETWLEGRAENITRQPVTVAREAAANREKVRSPLESNNTRVCQMRKGRFLFIL